MNGRELIDAETVHNWGAPHVRNRWKGKLTTPQEKQVSAAMVRHHQQGTSAAEEARALNEAFGWAVVGDAAEPPDNPD